MRSTTATTHAPRRWLAAAALLMAAVLMAHPAAAQTAGAWPQHGADAANTRQAEAVGPSDPGLKWLVNLEDVETAEAPEGYSRSSNEAHAPILGPDGLLITLVQNEDSDLTVAERNQLIGLEPADGTVRWSVPNVSQATAPALDSSGRLWVCRAGLDHDLEALDPVTGDPEPDTQYTTDPGDPSDDRLCGTPGHLTTLHIGGEGADERLLSFDRRTSNGVVALDVSGNTPTLAWGFERDDPTAGFDEFVRAVSQPRIGVFTDDSVFVPTLTGEDEAAELELVELALADGDDVRRFDLPPVPEEGGDADATDIGTVNLMLPGDGTLIAGAARSGAGHSFVAGFDLGNASGGPDWVHVHESTNTSGQQLLALGDGVALTRTDANELGALTPAGGVAWIFGEDVIDLGAGATFRLVTDAAGNGYSQFQPPGTSPQERAVLSVEADGQERWHVRRPAIKAAAGLDLDEVSGALANFQVGPIDADGTLYVHRDEYLVAIDDSGGLAAPTFDEPAVRCSGGDRFETSVEISRCFFEPGVDALYVATGTRFPDALTGGVAAALDDAPLLLVRRDVIPDTTAQEITRLDPGRIVILGGEAVVSAQVEAELAGFTDGPVERLHGDTRFGTAAAVSGSAFPAGASTAFVATGTSFPDALSGAALAADGGGPQAGPVLLATRDSLPEDTANELARLNLDEIVILGGEAVISQAVAQQLNAFATDGVVRISGPTRFDTSAEVASNFAPPHREGVRSLFIATGTTFPDALSGGPVAGAEPAPILLVRRDSIPDPIRDVIGAFDSLERIVVLGGPGVVSQAVMDEIEALALGD